MNSSIKEPAFFMYRVSEGTIESFSIFFFFHSVVSKYTFPGVPTSPVLLFLVWGGEVVLYLNITVFRRGIRMILKFKNHIIYYNRCVLLMLYTYNCIFVQTAHGRSRMVIVHIVLYKVETPWVFVYLLFLTYTYDCGWFIRRNVSELKWWFSISWCYTR